MQEFFNDIEIIKNPISKTAVVFQCDEKFFNEYGIYNLLSCEQNDLDAHIHFINPSQSFLDKISNLQTDINLSYSIEHINTDINHYKLKSYYFCSRYFILADSAFNDILDVGTGDTSFIISFCFEENNRGVLSVDSICLPITGRLFKSPSMSDVDVAKFCIALFDGAPEDCFGTKLMIFFRVFSDADTIGFCRYPDARDLGIVMPIFRGLLSLYPSPSPRLPTSNDMVLATLLYCSITNKIINIPLYFIQFLGYQ